MQTSFLIGDSSVVIKRFANSLILSEEMRHIPRQNARLDKLKKDIQHARISLAPIGAREMHSNFLVKRCLCGLAVKGWQIKTESSVI